MNIYKTRLILNSLDFFKAFPDFILTTNNITKNGFLNIEFGFVNNLKVLILNTFQIF